MIISETNYVNQNQSFVMLLLGSSSSGPCRLFHSTAFPFLEEISIAVVKKQGFLGKWAAAT